MTTIEGTLEQISYHDEETHYTVARMKTAAADALITVVGHLPGARAGETIRFAGKWTTHPRYGQQFKFESADLMRPASLEGIQNYLESGIVKGIGRVTAKKLVARFGDQTLSVIEHTPEKLMEIDGIGQSRADEIHQQFIHRTTLQRIMGLLQENGINPSYCGKIFKIYGDDSLQIIETAPYRLANDIPGIGFAMADRIARNQGADPDCPERTEACIRHLITSAVNEGHVCVDETALLAKAARQFELDDAAIAGVIDVLVRSGEIHIETIEAPEAARLIYPVFLYQAEKAVADRINTLLSTPVPPPERDVEQILSRIEQRLIIALAPEQRQVLQQIFQHRFAIITGGPGTGKTTLIRSVSAMLELTGCRVCLAAPTGRAARRLSDAAQRPAHTIHKLLEYHFEDRIFGKNAYNPIEADVVIVDEASMVDIILMHHLLQAIPLTARLILVGDACQLPSIGAGNLLTDLIEADTLPVFALQTIFRQAAESRIIINAHHVRNGEDFNIDPPGTDLAPDTEFCFIEQAEPEKAAAAIVDLCTNRLPDMFGLDPVEDIQVLSPMHKGISGTIDLNQRLQKALNPRPGISANGRRFKPGDKVMHLKNNYQKEVFNGDIGTICAMDVEKERITVNFYGREVGYDIDELDDLTLGYAITVHKSQGSEYPVILLPLLTRHYVMLQRNLLYTAMTRAQKLVILIGSPKALTIALNNNRPQLRLSGLTARIRGCRI